jgi:nitrite reductase/ring-hydroxylating ferredoxin subunit
MSRRHPQLKSVHAASDLRTAPTIAIADLPSCKGGTGISRREFCALAGSGLLGLGLSACVPTSPRIVVGDGVEGTDPGTSHGPPIDGSTSDEDLAQSPNADLAHSPNADLANGPHDMAMTTNSCSGPYNAGLASAITTGQAKYITDNSNFAIFLCRDSGGLYALDAQCTHEGQILTKKTNEFYCSRHGATFDLNGQNPTSPAFSPLAHYSLCIDGGGNVLIDYNKTVSSSTRA